jgi:filamentous hemagglutinin family protein
MSFGKKCAFAWTVSLLLSASYLGANPTGGQVAAGSASIHTAPGTVTVNQASNQAVIDWQSFSIGSNELTKFIQPSSNSAVLNRVLGGETSILNGTLSANGQVYLINGNGIIVGPTGSVIPADLSPARATSRIPISFRAIFTSPGATATVCRIWARSTPSAVTSS